MQAWFAPIWWKSATTLLIISLVMVAAGLWSFSGKQTPTANAFGAICMFLSGFSSGAVAKRLRAARAPKN